jgi:protein-disulfide isomerase
MQRSQLRNRLITLSLVTIGALLVAFVLIYPNIKPLGEVATAEPFPRPNPQANTMGDPNAPIKIEEYSDFQCPVCARFFEDMEPELVRRYIIPGTVYFVYRSMGEWIGPESVAAAEAAYCAGDQNKFWEMHDTIFANHSGENVGDYTDRRLKAFAETIALDMGAFNSCFDGNKYNSQVRQDQADGQAAGLRGTPSFVFTYSVNGVTKTRFLGGAYPIEDPSAQSDFKREIEAALAEMGQ